MLSVRGMTMLNDDIDTLSEQVHRLLIENKLLRAASEEQRELNGELRTIIKELQEQCAGYLNGEWI